jgi:hypothetical protein
MENVINKAILRDLIEPHLNKELRKETYDLHLSAPHELLTWNRLDIAFKLIYLDYRNVCATFARDIYLEHINALTLGEYTEPGNIEKNSKEKFIAEFNRTYENISSNGFDTSRSLIPQASDGSIANGSHRLASAIHANKNITCVNVESLPHIYDYQFFYNRRVSKASIEVAVSKFIEAANNVYIALIWPSASGRNDDIARLIPNVIYKKEVKLNFKGSKNLLIKVYHSEAWIGNPENGFRGIEGKLVECFKHTNPLRIVAFQADSLDQVLSIKQGIRDLFNIDKHSIHITDTKDEAIRVARLLFNENSIHFLNHGAAYKYISSYSKINKLNNFIQLNNIDEKEILVDGSLLLSLYGLRESMDIDYLSLNILPYPRFDSDINNHDEDLKYHQVDKSMLISNPLFHFYYDDVKLISFHQLYRMKKNRAEEKDLNDLKMMDGLLNNDRFASFIASIRQNVYYSKVKFKSRVIVLLKKLKLYELVRALYRKMDK